MHERNSHQFPLDLASSDSIPVAFIAPTVGWESVEPVALKKN
jgi:hypothetical protein